LISAPFSSPSYPPPGAGPFSSPHLAIFPCLPPFLLLPPGLVPRSPRWQSLALGSAPLGLFFLSFVLVHILLYSFLSHYSHDRPPPVRPFRSSLIVLFRPFPIASTSTSPPHIPRFLLSRPALFLVSPILSPQPLLPLSPAPYPVHPSRPPWCKIAGNYTSLPKPKPRVSAQTSSSFQSGPPPAV